MNIIDLDPYQSIENKDFLETTILKINKEKFNKAPFYDDKITFSFINCRFNNFVVENKEIIDFFNIRIQFVGCYIENFDANEIVSRDVSLLFNSSVFSGTIQSINISHVLINNCIISNNIFLIGQRSIEISYTEENIFPRRWKNLIKKMNTTFSELIKTKQYYRIFNSEKIIFRTNEIHKKKSGLYKKDYQANDQAKVGYYLKSEEKKLFNIHLSIKYSQGDKNVETRILSSYLQALSLSGYSTGKIIIENSKILEWFIRDFSTDMETNFYNIGPPENEIGSKIEIHKSNLNNTWFDNIDFRKYDIVSFFRTKFGKTIFTSCDFPTDYISFEKFKTIENVHYPEKKSDNYYKDQYEIFLQLKTILETTGNFYEAQKLQAISNDALKKIKHISKWDKCILWINGKSNNHGLSIKLPLVYLVIFSVTFYILYLLSLGRILNRNDIDYSLFGYYFLFLDLTHRSDFLVNKEEFNAYSLLIDFISKVLIGFFIYQFISAFRKYGKK